MKIKMTTLFIVFSIIVVVFAHLNDDVLFGEVWNEEGIDIQF